MRKIFRYNTVILFLFLFESFVFAQQQQQIPWPTLADSPWPMMSHDPQATGRSPYAGPKTPNIIWTMDMPYGIWSGPAIGEDGTIYFGTRSYLPADTTNYFYAVNPDGTIKWTYRTGEISATKAGFLVGNDSTIYFTSSAGLLYAIDLNGELKWTYSVEINNFYDVMNTDLEGNIYLTSYDQYLHSVNRSGTLNWKVKYDDGFRGRSVVIAPDGQTLYISGKDSSLYALNLDGSIKWIYPSEEIRMVPMVDNSGNIYITPRTSPAQLHSIYPNGEVKWIFLLKPFGPRAWSSPTIDKDGNIYFTFAADFYNTGISSVDYNGNFRWTYIFEDVQEDIGVPLISDANGTIYCGSAWGYYYYAISKEGELLWRIPLNGYMVDGSGAIDDNGTLYIGTHLGSLATGQKRTLIAVRDSGVTTVDDSNFLNDYSLIQNYPNPFNPGTTIRYSISESSLVTLKVYDILGKEIAKLVDEQKRAGTYTVNFNASNLSSGVYIYRFTASNNGRILFTDTKQMILMK